MINGLATVLDEEPPPGSPSGFRRVVRHSRPLLDGVAGKPARRSVRKRGASAGFATRPSAACRRPEPPPPPARGGPQISPGGVEQVVVGQVELVDDGQPGLRSRTTSATATARLSATTGFDVRARSWS